MARILNTCDLAMAQNGLRNAMHTARAEGDAAASMLTRALRSLWEAIIDPDQTVTIDRAAEAFEAVGYSRDLGAAAFRHVGRMSVIGSTFLTTDEARRCADDVRATPEWARLERLYAEPVTQD